MEKRLLRIEIIVITIFIITLINLFLPYIIDLDNSEKQNNKTATTKELPADLTKQRLNKITYKIKTDFNHSDWNEFHNVFGEFAKAQINVEDIESGFIKLKTVVGNIQTYAYSHYEYEENRENADWFIIYYKCRFDNGKGSIKISTRTLDNVSEVTGVNIVLDEL